MTEEQAYAKLSAMCARAEHCTHDATEKMRRWGMTDDEQERVVRRLVDGRFIDNERYCRAFIREKIRQNKWGRMKIALALRMKRIPDGMAERALDEVDASAYTETLRSVLAAKAKTVRPAAGWR